MAGLGDRLRAAREAAGLTQEQLAEKMNTTQSVVSAWESESRTISFRRLRDFARAASTTPDALDPERVAYHPNRPRPGRIARPHVAAPSAPARAQPPAGDAGSRSSTRDRVIALIDLICETDADWAALRRAILEHAASDRHRE